MSTGDSTRVIQPYRGSIERPKPLLELAAPFPYAATVTVTAMPYLGIPDQQFEIAASWFGPALPGAYPPATGPVHANDVFLIEDEQLARQVAHRAKNALARAEIPDLLTLSGQVRNTPISPPA